MLPWATNIEFIHCPTLRDWTCWLKVRSLQWMRIRLDPVRRYCLYACSCICTAAKSISLKQHGFLTSSVAGYQAFPVRAVIEANCECKVASSLQGVPVPISRRSARVPWPYKRPPLSFSYLWLQRDAANADRQPRVRRLTPSPSTTAEAMHARVEGSIQ